MTALAIVPVQVKARGTDKVVETHAFLDNGSNTTFYTTKLLHQLNVEGTKSQLSLTTLEGENRQSDCVRVSLGVTGLGQDTHIHLPTVYSRTNLPIPTEAIATQKDIDRWPHLSGIKVPTIDAEIGLLIGSDVPQALEPLEVRRSDQGGPNATKTTLGWVFNGPP